MLDVSGLTMRFGGLTAVSGLDFSAKANQITSVIGPNGAGKDDGVQLHHRLLPPDGWHHRPHSSGRRHPCAAYPAGP